MLERSKLKISEPESSQPKISKPKKSIKIADQTLVIEEILHDQDDDCKIFTGTWEETRVVVKEMKYGKNGRERRFTYKDCMSENEIHKILGKSGSPYIVKYYNCDVDRDVKYFRIVMEYIPKGSLGSYIENPQQTPFEWDVRYKLSKSLIKGVCYIHQKKILHGDIKSSNVLLTENNKAKLCDFGLSEKLDLDGTISTINSNYGTAAWMAPEIILEAATITLKADVYSLAVTLGEIAIWDSPFKNCSTANEIKTKVKNGERPELPVSCPSSLLGLIRFGLLAEPNQRPTADEMLSDLKKGKEEFQLEYKRNGRM